MRSHSIFKVVVHYLYEECQFMYCGCTKVICPFEPCSQSLCFMAQMLWEKAIRWYKLRHASFLAMTAVAVAWPKYLNIHLVLFPNRHIFADAVFDGDAWILKSEHDCWFYKWDLSFYKCQSHVVFYPLKGHWRAFLWKLEQDFVTGWKVSRPGTTIAHKRPGHVFQNLGLEPNQHFLKPAMYSYSFTSVPPT